MFDRFLSWFGVHTDRMRTRKCMERASILTLYTVWMDGRPANCLFVDLTKTNLEEILRKQYGDNHRIQFRLVGPVDEFLAFGFKYESQYEDVGVVSRRHVYEFDIEDLVCDFMKEGTAMDEPYFFSALSWAVQHTGQQVDFMGVRRYNEFE